MTSTVSHVEKLLYKIDVTVNGDEVNRVYQQELNSIAKSAKLDGFRPGKVPTKVIESKYSKQLISGVQQQLVEKSLSEAVQEHELKVAGMPQIDPPALQRNQDYCYSATVEVYPEITFCDFNGVDLPQYVSEVTEDDIEKMMDNIREQHATWDPVAETAAQEGHQVKIDFKGFLDGKEFDGGSSEGFVLKLGSGQMIPGFESGIEGMKAGENKTIQVTFPEDYAVKDLAGKVTTFEITCHEVQVAILPELDDALAEKMGYKNGVSELREQVIEHMNKTLKQSLEAKNKRVVLDKILELNQIDVPNSLVDAEIEHLQKAALQQLAARQGMQELPDIELPRDPYVSEAQRRVNLGLLLAEYIRQQELKSDADAVKAKIEEIVGDSPQAQEMINWYYKNPSVLSEVEASILEDKAVALLCEAANCFEQKISFSELNQQAA